jgi:hypothetical protein
MKKNIALSTAEAEYYAASEIAIEIIYLRSLLKNMGFLQADDTPVYEDNTACIEWGNHIIGGRERAKHIDNRKHFAHKVIQNRHMRLVRVSTNPAGRHLHQGVAAASFRELRGRTHARCKGIEGTLSLRRGARTTTRPSPWLAGGGCFRTNASAMGNGQWYASGELT